MLPRNQSPSTCHKTGGGGSCDGVLFTNPVVRVDGKFLGVMLPYTAFSGTGFDLFGASGSAAPIDPRNRCGTASTAPSLRHSQLRGDAALSLQNLKISQHSLPARRVQAWGMIWPPGTRFTIPARPAKLAPTMSGVEMAELTMDGHLA